MRPDLAEAEALVVVVDAKTAGDSARTLVAEVRRVESEMEDQPQLEARVRDRTSDSRPVGPRNGCVQACMSLPVRPGRLDIEDRPGMVIVGLELFGSPDDRPRIRAEADEIDTRRGEAVLPADTVEVDVLGLLAFADDDDRLSLGCRPRAGTTGDYGPWSLAPAVRSSSSVRSKNGTAPYLPWR